MLIIHRENSSFNGGIFQNAGSAAFRRLQAAERSLAPEHHGHANHSRPVARFCSLKAALLAVF